DPPRGQEALQALVSGLAIDVDRIVGLDREAPQAYLVPGLERLEERVQGLFPRGCVDPSRPRDDSIHVENDGIEALNRQHLPCLPGPRFHNSYSRSWLLSHDFIQFV